MHLLLSCQATDIYRKQIFKNIIKNT